MRAPRTLTFYVVREVLLYTAIGMAAIAVVLVTRNLVRALDGLVGAGFAFGDLLTIVRILATMLAVFALPVAFLFGTLLAIGRMAADVEIVAMRACGIGLRTLTLPVVLMGFVFTCLTWNFALEAEPAARREMKTAIQELLARGALIEPGRFRGISGRMLYVDERDSDQKLYGIVISDRSDPEHPFLVFANRGEVSLDAETNEFVLELEDGGIHLEPANEEVGEEDVPYRRISFERFDYAIDVTGFLEAGGSRRAKRMTMLQLSEHAARAAAGEEDLPEKPPTYAYHWHRRIAGPLAPTLFGLVAVPLAIRRTRGARSMGALWCAALVTGYYMIQSLCEFLTVESNLAPLAGAWIPNLVYAALGIGLLLHARRASN
jgi:lipopolysaccharide export system permease protein